MILDLDNEIDNKISMTYSKEVIENINSGEVDGNGTVYIGDKVYVGYTDDYGTTKVKSVPMAKVGNAYNLGMSTSDYIQMDNTISKMRADYGSNGRPIRGSKKQKVITYLQNAGYSYSQIKSIMNSYGWKY